jgi:FLVCR family feline leukemia virus subgroup C receptor-related protein
MKLPKGYTSCCAAFLLAAVGVESFAPSLSRSNAHFFSNRLKTSLPGRTLLNKRKDSRSRTSLGGDENGSENGKVNGGVNGQENGAIDYTNVEPQVSPQRWVQLAYLSLLALLSDWVCFSVAAAPSTFQTSFGHSAASIIDIFLFTNVATSFLVTDVISKFGMQRAIQAAAVIMTTGCWLRAGIGFLPGQDGLVDYPFIVIGTVLVGIAQPFFQCTPPLLSAMWFANNERSTSTAIALNFNQIGIATAFLVGGSMATSAHGLENYFALIAVMTTLVTVGTLLQFQDEPLIPPSASELEKKIKGEEEPPFLESVEKFFRTRGFTSALAAFICSISITNVVGVSALWNMNTRTFCLFN